jgi:hypothetical protein
MIKWFLSLLLLMCSITFIDLHMLNHLCIPGMKLIGCGGWSFWCVVGFGLPLFYWGFLHRCSLRKNSSPMTTTTIWEITCEQLHLYNHLPLCGGNWSIFVCGQAIIQSFLNSHITNRAINSLYMNFNLSLEPWWAKAYPRGRDPQLVYWFCDLCDLVIGKYIIKFRRQQGKDWQVY